MQQEKTSILLLFGGESAEHDVSVASARNVVAALDSSAYELALCFIDKAGKWWLLDELGEEIDTASAQQLLPVLGEKKLVAGEQTIQPDVILPILHGPNGEDGTVQGLARLLHVPIVGCGVSASAVCMDKVLTKELLSEAGIATVPYVVHFAHEPAPKYENITAQLGAPLFIKPANMGSSVGVNKVTTEADFAQALEMAHQHDNKVLIEQGVTARELEVAMLGGGSEPIQASVVGEIKPQGDFYSYESKYSEDTASEMVIPADTPEEVSERIRRDAIAAFAAVGGKGISRIDFFLSHDGKVYLNEINTLPGFTNFSMYPMLWEQGGVGYAALIERLIHNALLK